MSAPVVNLSGSYTLDNERSDSAEPMMVMMDIPWLARKAALQFTPQQIIDHTETNFTYTVVQFVGSTTEGPFTIGSDWAPHKMNRVGDGLVKVVAVANGLSFEFKKEDVAIIVKSVYSLEDGGAYLLITIDFSKGSSNCKLRRFFKRDAAK